ncbi:MAG: HEAT repeat domain-containing protein, partial [Planctomycetota bacterium]
RSAPPASNVVTLVEDLRTSPLAWVRERAAEKLSGRTGKPQPGVVEALALALREDDSPWVRAAAAKALAELKPEGWDVRLAEALRNDGSVFVRRTCAKGFRSIHVSHSPPKPRLDKVVRAALVGALLSDTPRVAAAAAGTLGKFKEGEDELLQALESFSSMVRRAASGALSSLARGKKVLGRLVELLSDERPGMSLLALQTMPRACDVSEHIQEKIAERLSAPDARVRAAAAWKFCGHNSPSTEVQARIEKLLQDADPRVRLAAASALGKTDDAARKVLESLKDSAAPTGVAGSSTVGRRARMILGEPSETDMKELLDELRWLKE